VLKGTKLIMDKRKTKTKKKPSKKTAAQKGNALEQAVAAIERLILSKQPDAKGRKFTIEPKKIIRVAKVRHEIDLFVTVDFGPGYRSIFLFECKNWATPVDKNEIIVFSSKIQAAGASHGYFIAKSFTKDANAQAQLDSRMTLLIATEHEPITNPLLSGSWGVGQRYEQFTLRITAADGLQLSGSNGESFPVLYQGQTVELEQLLRSWSYEVSREKMHDFTYAKPDGIYDFDCEYVRTFSPGWLHVLGKDVAQIEVALKSKIQVARGTIESDFDVQSRGRIITTKPVNIPGITFKSQIVILYQGDKGE
jgi:hypothetical protein